VYYSKLDSNGNVLVDHLKIGGSISTTRPSIAVDGSNKVHVAWSESKDDNPEIYYAKLDNNGNNLLNGNIRITNNQAFSTSPRIAVDGVGQIIIVWSDSSAGNPEIFYTKLDSSGNKVLGGDIRITNKAGRSFLPSIAVEKGSGDTHIAFLEINDDHPDNVELYYAKVGSSGAIEIPAIRITFTENQLPIADAGNDQSVDAGDTVELDGSGSYDPDGDDLSFSWKHLSGPTVIMKAPGSSNPTFIAPVPTGSSSLVLEFQLVVTDSKSSGQQDTVVVTVEGSSSNCAGLTPTIIGTENADVLTGTAGVDIIAGWGGDDVIKGLDGNDVICGGGGNDTIYGGDGNDELYGGDGNDIIYGTAGDDKLYGDVGADKLYGGIGIDTADGGSETDSCFAESKINC
jgi:Ca2+-binding RTX toxin-like protein